jgi:uncharacterized protein YigE (DUF2233 family)
MSDEQTTVAEQATETQEAQAGVDLTVQDLAALKQIIDVASQRGAFKPNEMMTVGQTYSKLEAFLAEVQKQQAAQTEAA